LKLNYILVVRSSRLKLDYGNWPRRYSPDHIIHNSQYTKNEAINQKNLLSVRNVAAGLSRTIDNIPPVTNMEE
jgi:hypothetical protein